MHFSSTFPSSCGALRIFFRGDLGVQRSKSDNGDTLILALRVTFSVALSHTFNFSGPVSLSVRYVDFLRTLPALRIGE